MLFTLFDADVSNTELFTRRKGSSGEVSVVSYGANIGKTEGVSRVFFLSKVYNKVCS